jgi:hypothetical protein
MFANHDNQTDYKKINIEPKIKIPSYMKKNEHEHEHEHESEHAHTDEYKYEYTINEHYVPDPFALGNDPIGMFFLGSFTVVGLFVLYRMMDRYGK